MFDDGPAVMLGVAVPAELEAGVGAALGSVVESGSGWSALAPSGLLLDVLAGLSPESLDAGEALDAAAAADRVVSFAQAVQVRLLARFAALRPADDDAGGGQGRRPVGGPS